MKHFYKDVKGWFAFLPIYEQAVREAPDPAHFVEVGAWKGRSAAYMAVEIINSGKKIRFDCVDTWLGTDHSNQRNDADVMAGALFETFLRNTAPVRQSLTIIRRPSLEAAASYADESLDFVMIDADHAYEPVRADIAAWWPKIKQGGVLAGDDWIQRGVNRAVEEFFGSRAETFPPPVGKKKSFGQWRVKKT